MRHAREESLLSDTYSIAFGGVPGEPLALALAGGAPETVPGFYLKEVSEIISSFYLLTLARSQAARAPDTFKHPKRLVLLVLVRSSLLTSVKCHWGR